MTTLRRRQRGLARSHVHAALGLVAWAAITVAFGWYWWGRAFVHRQSFEILSVQGAATFGAAPAAAGMSGELEDGTALATGPDAVVTLRLGEGSVVQFAPDTRARVLEARTSGDRRTHKTVIALDAGEIIRKLPPAGAGGVERRAELITPTVNIGVRGTEFVASAAGAASRAMVHRGAIALAGAAGAPKDMTENYGTVIATGLEPEAPSVLLPPPAPDAPATVEATEEAAVAFRWQPVPGATGYLLEVADNDANFDAVVLRRQTDATAVEGVTLPFDAPLHWRVASIDARGLRGRGSEPRLLHYRPHHARLRALTAAGDSAAALAQSAAATHGYAADAALRADIGWAHYVAGDFAAARDEYDRALAAAPGDAGTLLRRGRALYWLKDHAAAEADYRRALALVPGDADALWGLAEVELATDRTEAAIAHLREALAEAPAHAYANLTLARALAPTDPAGARQALARHLAINPTDAAALELKARLP